MMYKSVKLLPFVSLTKLSIIVILYMYRKDSNYEIYNTDKR